MTRCALIHKEHRGGGFRWFRDDQVDAVILMDTGVDLGTQILVEEGVDENGGYPRRRVAIDNALDFGLSPDGALTIAGEEFPGKRAVFGERGVEVYVIQPL